MINRERLIKTFCDIVQIDSPSGEEELMAQEIIARLEKMGFATKRDAYGNVVASDGRPNPILLSAHLDTVDRPDLKSCSRLIQLRCPNYLPMPSY